jgi:hypothetical protein
MPIKNILRKREKRLDNAQKRRYYHKSKDYVKKIMLRLYAIFCQPKGYITKTMSGKMYRRKTAQRGAVPATVFHAEGL